MFQTKLTPVHLPNEKALHAIEQEAMRCFSAITDEMLAKLLVPEHYGAKLKELWDGTVSLRNADRAIEMFCHTSRHGEVLLACDCKQGQASLKLLVVPVCGDEGASEDSDESGVVEFSAEDSGEWTEDERNFLRGVWTPFDPVKPIKGAGSTAPNSKCTCNSGKKFKRCCGRYA